MYAFQVKIAFFTLLLSVFAWENGVAMDEYRTHILAEIQKLQAEYQKKSTGNGWIAVREVACLDIEEKIETQSFERFRATYLAEVAYLLEECTLLWRGGDGRIFTRNSRFMLAEATANHLYTLWQEHSTSLELAPFAFWYNPSNRAGFAADTSQVNTPCSLVIPIGNGRAFQLDGHSGS